LQQELEGWKAATTAQLEEKVCIPQPTREHVVKVVRTSSALRLQDLELVSLRQQVAAAARAQQEAVARMLCVQAVRFVEPQIVHAYLLQARKPISKRNVHRWVWHWHCSASCKVTSQRYQCSYGSRCTCCCRGYRQFLVHGIKAIVQRYSQCVLLLAERAVQDAEQRAQVATEKAQKARDEFKVCAVPALRECLVESMVATL
jgi:hypothetical protein